MTPPVILAPKANPLRRRFTVAAFCFVAVVSLLVGEDFDLADLSLGELMNVEVSTPGKVSEKIREIPASVYLYSRDDIEAEGYRSLTDVLESVPGFYNIDNYNGVSGNFGVRGYWNGRSQNGSFAILVNGVPQTRMDSRSHPMELLNVPIEAIDRIEVARGPNSVIYGNGASFGAINIITDESFHENRASTSISSAGDRQLDGRWSMFGEDGHLILNTGVSTSDGPDYTFRELMSSGNLDQLSLYGIDDPDASLEGKLENELRYLQMAGEWKSMYFDFSYNGSVVEHFPGAPPLEDGSVRSTESMRFMLGGRRSFTNEVHFDTRVIYHDFDLSQDFDSFYPGFVGTNTLNYESWEVESLLTFEPSDSFRALVGVNWQRMQNMYELTNIPLLGLNKEAVDIDRRDTQSLFTQFSYQATNRLRLIGGFRIEELRPFERLGYTNIDQDIEPTFGGVVPGQNNFTPRASLIYQASNAHLFKAMLGDAVKLSPSSSDFFMPERIRTAELNYIYSGDDLIFSLSFFRNRLSGLQIEILELGTDGSVDTDSFAGGKVETSGVEILLRRDFGEKWSTEFGVTFQDSDNLVRPDLGTSYSPDCVAHGKLIYRDDDFSWALIGRFVGSMLPYHQVDAPNGSGGLGDYIGDEADAYFVTDLNFRWENLWEDIYLNFRVSNLFDERVRYPNNPINSSILDRGLIGDERKAYLTVGLEF